MVKLLVLLLGDIGRLAGPEGLGVVDDVVLVSVDVLAVLPLLHLAERDGNRQETAILFEKLIHFRLLAILLAVVR